MPEPNTPSALSPTGLEPTEAPRQPEHQRIGASYADLFAQQDRSGKHATELSVTELIAKIRDRLSNRLGGSGAVPQDLLKLFNEANLSIVTDGIEALALALERHVRTQIIVKECLRSARNQHEAIACAARLSQPHPPHRQKIHAQARLVAQRTLADGTTERLLIPLALFLSDPENRYTLTHWEPPYSDLTQRVLLDPTFRAGFQQLPRTGYDLARVNASTDNEIRDLMGKLARRKHIAGTGADTQTAQAILTTCDRRFRRFTQMSRSNADTLTLAQALGLPPGQPLLADATDGKAGIALVIYRDAASHLQEACNVFRQDNRLPESFLQDERHAGPRAYWQRISNVLVTRCQQAQALLQPLPGLSLPDISRLQTSLPASDSKAKASALTHLPSHRALLAAASQKHDYAIHHASHVLNLIVPADIRDAMTQARTVDEARATLSMLCRRPAFLQEMTDIAGTPIASGEAGWAVLGRLVLATGIAADWATDNGQASIAAFIAPGMAEQRLDFPQAVFTRVLLTQAYDPPEDWRPGMSRRNTGPVMESPVLMTDSTRRAAVQSANLVAVNETLKATTSQRPPASTILAHLGVYDLSAHLPTQWGALDDYRFLRALPHFSTLAAKMSTGTADTPVSPGQQSHLLIEALLSTVEVDLEPHWSLGPQLTAPDVAVGLGWHQLRGNALRAISQKLLDQHCVDDPEHGRFLARLLLQRERPEWFLKDVESIRNDYARDVASITWRYAVRLCEAVAPRSTLGRTLDEVVSLAGELEKLGGTATLSPGTGDSTENELSTLSGLLMAQSLHAWGNVWEAGSTTQLLATLNRVEQNCQSLLSHLGAQQPPDLMSMARKAMRDLGADPDEPVQVTENADTHFNFSQSPTYVVRRPNPISTVSAVQRFLMKDATVFQEARATVVNRYQRQVAQYTSERLALAELQIMQAMQQLPMQTLELFDRGRWRVHRLSSRNAQLYREGVFAVVEVHPGQDRPPLYLAARKNRSGDLLLQKEPIEDARKEDQGGLLNTALQGNLTLRMTGKAISLASRSLQDVPVEGIGLVPGDWQDGQALADRTSLHPIDPGSSAWKVACQLAKPLWTDPMEWEAAFEVEKKGRAPWQGGSAFSLWSLIPLYDYFSKPVAERGEEDHRAAVLEIGLLFAPGAVHASRAVSLLNSVALRAARAGLLRTIGQGLTLKTVVGGLQGVVTEMASPLFRRGLVAGGLQLTYAAGETLLNILPMPTPGPRWFGKRIHELWQALPGLGEKTTRVMDTVAAANRLAADVTANRIQPLKLGNISEYAVKDGDALLRQARRHVFNDSLTLYHLRDSHNAERWLLRYTDDTRIEKVYEIKSNFKPQNNYVEIIDPASRRRVLTVYYRNAGWQRLTAKGGQPNNGRKITFEIVRAWQDIVKADSRMGTLKQQGAFAKSHGLKERSLWEYVSASGELADEGKFLKAEFEGRTFVPPTAQQLKEWRDLPAAARRKTSQFQFAMDRGIQLRSLIRNARKTGELTWEGQYAVDLAEGRTFRAPTPEDLNAWKDLPAGHAIPWYRFARDRSINPKTFARQINRRGTNGSALSAAGEHAINKTQGQALREITARDIQAWRDLPEAERRLTSREAFAVGRNINPNLFARHITSEGIPKPLGEFRIKQAAGTHYHEPTVEEIIEWRDLSRAERAKTSRDRFALDKKIDVPSFQVHVKGNGELTVVGEVRIKDADEAFKPLTAQDLIDWRDMPVAERLTTNRKTFANGRGLNPRVFSDEAQATGELKPLGLYRVAKAEGVEFHEITAAELSAWRDLTKAERRLTPWYRFALDRQIDLKSFKQFSYTTGKPTEIGDFMIKTAKRKQTEPPRALPTGGPPTKRPRLTPKKPMSLAQTKAHVAHRAIELQSQLPPYTKDKTTMAVAVLNAPEGQQIAVIASSNPRGYLPKGVTVNPGERFVRGNLHAEADIIEWAAQNRHTVAVIGAGRPICAPCAKLIEAVHAVPATPLKKV